VPTALPRAADAPACDRSGLRSDHTPDACGGIGPFAMRLLWSAQPLDRPVPDRSPPIASRPTFKFLRFLMSANTGGPHARKNGLLHAAFHPEESDGIRFLQCAVDEWIVLRQMRQIHRLFIVLGDRSQTVLADSHHARPQQTDSDDLHVRAIVFVPLDDMAPGHRCGFQWNDGIKLALADDEAARVLAQVPWQLQNFFC
jgi:hypothetical protein